MQISFCVPCSGYHIDKPFNPIGKPSDTNPKRWTKETKARLQKYHDWQHQIREVFSGAYFSKETTNKKPSLFKLNGDLKIIYDNSHEFLLTCHFYCLDKRHADLSNMIKAVEDSLFENDHNIIGYPDMQRAVFIDSDNPRVECSLEIL